MFPSRGVWRRPGLHPVDLLVFAALLALLFGLLRLAPALNAPFLPKTAPSTVSTDPANLPYYAVRSLFRMFIGLILSVLFTFVYATAAARLPRAEKVLIPVLDILQSVPVLGFLAASESISVLNHTYALPGIGSYVAAAVEQSSLSHVGIAIGVMMVMVLAVNFMFWRPVVAWAERFRTEESAAAERPRSMVLDVLRRSTVPDLVARPLRPAGRLLDTITRPFGLAEHPLQRPAMRARTGDVFFFGAVSAVIIYGAWRALDYLHMHLGLGAFGHVFVLGAATFARVVVLLIVASVIWVPIGVWIGMDPRVSRLAQPVVQVLASFPANFLFPFAAAFFVAAGISLNIGGILLMALGAQWYILFNVIAGASAIPSDLREAMTLMGVRGRARWTKFILPAIFPAYVTGGITAAGGAWNAAIVAEVITYGHHHLTATGLGAYIAQAATVGDFPEVLMGVVVMSVYVVGLNRLVWRRLYRLAETRYSL